MRCGGKRAPNCVKWLEVFHFELWEKRGKIKQRGTTRTQYAALVSGNKWGTIGTISVCIYSGLADIKASVCLALCQSQTSDFCYCIAKQHTSNSTRLTAELGVEAAALLGSDFLFPQFGSVRISRWNKGRKEQFIQKAEHAVFPTGGCKSFTERTVGFRSAAAHITVNTLQHLHTNIWWLVKKQQCNSYMEATTMAPASLLIDSNGSGLHQ